MDTEQDQECSLCLDNYQTILSENITDFLNKKAFVDVTLVCEGEEIRAHQMILAAFSPLFKTLLIGRSKSNPIIIFTDVTKEEVIALLEFIYKGKVNVPRSSLPGFLRVAQKLQIRGINHEISRRNKEYVCSSELPEGILQQNLQKPPAINTSTIVEPMVLSPVKEKIPRSISSTNNSRNGGTSKVKNPFAVKKRHIENASTFRKEDLVKPGPSKAGVYSAPTRNNDSDVEIIENNSVVVINILSQPDVDNSLEWSRKTQPRNKKGTKSSSQNKTFIDISSEDSDMSSKLPQKMAKRTICPPQNVEEDKGVRDKGVRGNLLALKRKDRNQKLNSSIADSSTRLTSPELVPLASTSKDIGVQIKNKKNIKTKLEKYKEHFKMSLYKLGRFCIICKKFKRNTRFHVKHAHKVPPRRKYFACRKCSRSFYFEKVLAIHKCRPLLIFSF